MQTIYLKEFIKTGNFGEIIVGVSTRDDLIRLLEKNFDFADCGESCIIKYGWYEFFYWSDTKKIFGIQNDHVCADCVNHKEMISFQNRLWKLDTWFLKELSHVTFAQIMNYLRQENIAFEVITFSKYSDEQGIRCVDSCVTFDFVDEYCTVERTKRKKVKTVKELKVTHQDDFVLNGIRLWEHES